MADKKRDSLAFVLDMFHASESWRADFINEAKEWLRAWRAYTKRTQSPEEQGKRSNLAKPHIHIAVEHAVARMLSSLTQSSPIVRVLPREPSDVERARAVEMLLDYQFERARLKLKLETWLRERAIFGFAPVYPYWRFDTEERSLRVETPEGIVTVKDEIPTFDGPDFDVGSVKYFYPDPWARDFTPDGIRWCIRRYWRSVESLKRKAKVGAIDEEALKDLDTKALPPIDDPFGWDDREFAYSPEMATIASGEDVVEILEFLSSEKIITVANRRVVLREVENPFGGELPFIVALRLPRPEEPFGVGFVEPILRTWYQINAIANARIDNLALILRPMWKIRRGMVDKSQLVAEAGRVIELGDPEDAGVLQFPDVTASSFQEELFLKGDIEGATINETARGQAPPNVRSGAQALALIEAASERLQMDISSFVETGLVPLARFFLSLSRQFLDAETAIRVIGPKGIEFVTISPQDLANEYDIKVEAGVRNVPKALEAEQLLNLAGAMTGILANYPEHLVRVFEVVAEKMGQKELELVLSQIREGISLTPPEERAPAQRGGARSGPGNAKTIETLLRTLGAKIG